MFAALVQGLILGFPNAGVPGPFQAYILSQVMRYGWKRSLSIALAPLVSDGPIIGLVIFILAQLPKGALGIIQLVGGLFILFLAFGAYRSIRSVEEEVTETVDTRAGFKGFFKAVLMNILNPAPYIFWGTVGGPILLKGWRESPLVGVAFLVGFYGTLVAGFAVLIRVLGTASGLSPRAKKILCAISALALAVFGLVQLFLGIRSVLGLDFL